MTIQNKGGRKDRTEKRDLEFIKQTHGIVACLNGSTAGQSRRVKIIAEELRRMLVERAGK